MATKSFEELNTGALTIKNNELPESNTHTLVGNQLVDMVAKEQEIDGKVNDLATGEGSNIDILKFNPETVAQLEQIGQVRYNPATQCLEVKLNDEVTLSVGLDNYMRGKNADSIDLEAPMVVFVSGGLGSNAMLTRASNDAVLGEKVIGVITQGIAKNNIGFVATSGIVNNINTSAYAEGDVLWLGVNGALTNVKPDVSVNQICIGVVLRSHATEGSLLVAIKDDWRGQVAQLRSDLSELEKVQKGINLFNNPIIGFYYADLNFEANPAWKCQKIDIESYIILYINCKVRENAYISLTDVNNNILWQSNSLTNDFEILDLSNYTNSKWLYVSNETSLLSTPVVTYDKQSLCLLSNLIDILSHELDNIIDKTYKKGTTPYSELATLPGYINASGILTSSGTWFHTDYLPIELLIEIKTGSSHPSVCAVAFYDIDKNFISGITSASIVTFSSITIPSNAVYVISSGEKIKWATGYITMYQDIQGVYKIKENVYDLQKDINSLKNNNSWSHFSFDDITYCLQDITTNASIYTSIFENPFFALLKEMHDTYGATFSLFCYQAYESWAINMVTDVFANEFMENADWLKFGMHSSASGGNFDSSTAEYALASWNNFVTEIHRITGTYKTIDLCPRLHGFGGNLLAMSALRDATPGMVGFLGADTTPRNSYYLNESDSLLLFNKGKFVDYINRITFYQSLARFDGNNPAVYLPTLYSEIGKYNKSFNLEMFMHEYSLYTSTFTINVTQRAYLESACQWAKQKKYRWTYAMHEINS